MQISAAQRAAEEETGIKNFLSTNPDLGTAENQRALLAVGGTKGLGYLKAFSEQKKASLESDKLSSELLGLAHKNFNSANSPYAAAKIGPDGVTEYVKNMYADPLLGPQAKKVKPLEQAIQENLTLFTKDPTQWMLAHSTLEGQQLLDVIKNAEARAAETRAFAPPVVTPPVATPTAPAALPTTQMNAPAAPPVISQDRLAVSQDASGASTYYIDGKSVDPQTFAAARASSAPATMSSNTRAADLASMFPAAATAPAPVVAPAAATASAIAPVVAPAAQPDLLNNLALRIKGIEEQRNRLLPDIGKSAAVKAHWEDLGKQIENLKKSSETDSRLAFDREKFTWEKANPGKTIKEVTQGGVTKFFAINDRTGESTPVTIAGGKILTGTDMASQRLAFDQAKFSWEKANPGFTIQQTEDGSIVGVNNRTLQAYPVTLNAGTPPSPAPFTGVGGAAPSAGGGRGSVGVTDSRLTPTAPVVAPAGAPTAGMPLKGKTAGLTEAQSNAAMFGSSMAQAQNVLDEVERKGTNTSSVTTSLAQGIVKYVPLGIGDKLVQDVYSVAMQDPTKLFGPDVNQQRLGQAQLAFSIAYLRKTSGANFGASELVNTLNEFFPSIGEDSSVTKQKSESRKRAIAGMKISAGKEGAKFIEDYQKPNSGIGNKSSESDPLGIRK
jgi:hypothetical protein